MRALWSTTSTLHPAYNEYWFGILDRYGVRADAILCPSASSPLVSDPSSTAGRESQGYGTAFNCWTGRFGTGGTAITLIPSVKPVPGPDGTLHGGMAGIYRDGSYAYNRYLTLQNNGFGGFGSIRKASSLLQIHDLGNIPTFMDCVFADVQPDNYSAPAPPRLPKELSGVEAMPGWLGTGKGPEVWKLLIARHGNAINVGMADGKRKARPAHRPLYAHLECRLAEIPPENSIAACAAARRATP